MDRQFTIGMFDSGVGGLTVLREVQQRLPEHSFIYFGDTGRCPYGSKSNSAITRYSLESCEFLINKGIDLLVVACNTSSAVAMDSLRTAFQIPIIGMIEPAVLAVCESTKTERIGIIGTKATIGSAVFQKQLKEQLPHAEIIAIACPLFVPLIEEQFNHRTIKQMIIHEYLSPLKERKIDTLLLGCTHYPLLESLIQEELGDSVHIVNPAISAAQAVEKISPPLRKIKKNEELYPKECFFVSDDPEHFRAIGEHFFGRALPIIKTV